MPYCTVSDVQNLMQTTFTSTSRPDTTDVETFIDNIAGELDGVAQAAGYAVPITGAAALKLLRLYNTYGAAVPAWHAMVVADDSPARVTFWDEAYKAFISRLRRGEQQLPGEIVASEEDIAFAIAPHPQRDRYWLTGERLDGR